MATVKVSSELLDKFKSHIDADVLGSPDAIKLSPALVLAVALLYMMAADGQIEEAESSQLQSVVGNNDALLSSALAYVQAVPIEAFLEKAPEVLSQQDKQCILVNVFDSLLADGHADPEELELFGQMRNAFGVTEVAFKNAVHVITLKNDKSVFGTFVAIKADDARVSPHLAMAASLLYMMSSDGAIGPEEIGQLEAVIGEFEGLQAVALRYVRAVKREDFFIAIRKALTAQQKLCILTNVCDSMMSDGNVAVVEDKLFVSMVAAFGVKLNDFDNYYEVLEAKNIRPFDTSKFKQSTQHDRVAGEAGEDGEVFEMTGAASELGVEVRRTMHDNIDKVQHDFGSAENILQVNHNATDDLNIQQIGIHGSDVPNVQQVGSDDLGVNLQQVQVEPVNGNSAQWITGDAPGANRQALATTTGSDERQRLALERQSDNVQTLDVAVASENRQALEAAASGRSRALLAANKASEHLETLPPEERVKNLFQDVEVLTRQLDEFESKNKTLLNAARRARAQEEANQQALLNQQLAENAIALGQASSEQTLGVPKEHLKSNLQGLGAQAMQSNLQPLDGSKQGASNLAKIAKDPITDKHIGSPQSQTSKDLSAPKAHLQTNLQDVGIDVVTVNRQSIDAHAQMHESSLSGGGQSPENSNTTSTAAASLAVAQGATFLDPAESTSTSDIIATPQTQTASDAAVVSANQRASDSVHALLIRSARARHDFKVYVKLTLTFFVLSFWTSNIAAIHPAKQRMVSGSLVRIQHLSPDAFVVKSLGEL